jgi:hypothetical protein
MAAVERTPPAPSGAAPEGALAFVHGRRRLARTLLAGGLASAVVVGAAAGSQVGGPLYGPRLWVETVTLPGEPEARVAADLRRLDARLADAGIAAAAGDVDGARAALEQFAAVIDDALARVGNDTGREEQVARALEPRREALAALEPSVHASAAGHALRGVVDRLNAAIERLDGGQRPVADPSAGPNPPDDGSAGNAGGGSAGNGNGNEGGSGTGNAGGGSTGNGNGASSRPNTNPNANDHASPGPPDPKSKQPSH